jgi:hypothetical protein
MVNIALPFMKLSHRGKVSLTLYGASWVENTVNPKFYLNKLD